ASWRPACPAPAGRIFLPARIALSVARAFAQRGAQTLTRARESRALPLDPRAAPGRGRSLGEDLLGEDGVCQCRAGEALRASTHDEPHRLSAAHPRKGHGGAPASPAVAAACGARPGPWF